MTEDEKAERLARLAARRTASSSGPGATAQPEAASRDQEPARPPAPARRPHPAGTSRILVAGASTAVTLVLVSVLAWAGARAESGAEPAATGITTATTSAPPPRLR